MQVRRHEYAPWGDDHVELDAAAQAVEEIADDVIAQVTSA